VWAIRQEITSPIAMGCMLLDFFSNVKNRDAKNQFDIEGGT